MCNVVFGWTQPLKSVPGVGRAGPGDSSVTNPGDVGKLVNLWIPDCLSAKGVHAPGLSSASNLMISTVTREEGNSAWCTVTSLSPEHSTPAGTSVTLYRWEPRSTVCQHPIALPLRCVGSQVHTHPTHDPDWQQKAPLRPLLPAHLLWNCVPHPGDPRWGESVCHGKVPGRDEDPDQGTLWGGGRCVGWEIHHTTQAVQQSG